MRRRAAVLSVPLHPRGAVRVRSYARSHGREGPHCAQVLPARVSGHLAADGGVLVGRAGEAT
jgi:hypothetical protein